MEDIQITLDGLEETYNRVKDYIYQDTESPFRKVLKNIADLLDAHVKVKIRLNIDNYNKKELSILSDLLIERFSGRDGFSIYTAPLMETCLGTVNQRTKQQRQGSLPGPLGLERKVESSRCYIRNYITKSDALRIALHRSFQCACYLSRRQLAFCHDYVDGVLSGSIYGNEPYRRGKKTVYSLFA